MLNIYPKNNSYRFLYWENLEKVKNGQGLHRDRVLELFKKTILVLSENGLKWKYLWFFNILGKFWFSSNDPKFSQSVIFEHITSVELVNQIKLFVSVCLFVYLYLCSTIFWEWLNIFFRNFGYGPLRHCWSGHKHKKFTIVTNPREGGILGYFCPFLCCCFFLHSSFSWERFNILSWSFVKMFLVSLCYKKSQRGTLCWESFWVISGFILLYVPVFLENHSIFSHEILYICSWYTLTGTALFFHSCYVHLRPILVYVPLFLKNRSIFSHEILYIL